MSFFKRLFGGKPQPVTPAPTLAIEEMDLAEVITLIKSFEETSTVDTLIQVYRRLFDIANFEHGPVPEERAMASTLAASVRQDIEAAMANNPEGLNGFIEAADAHADMVPFHGFGSLQWIMDEHEITAAQLIPFACQPDFSDLLPTYLTMMPDEVMTDVRGEFIRNLVRARRERPELSDVRVLHGLIANNDRAPEILLRPAEFKTVQNMPTDYEAAETLVASIMNGNG